MRVANRQQTASAALPLSGQRILCPPSRIGPNPLPTMLERRGAAVTVFPRLRAEPGDRQALRDALSDLGAYDVLVVAGRPSAEQVLAQLTALGRSAEALPERLAAVGHGAVVVLRGAGRTPPIRPRDHFADGVADALGPVDGARVLLVREAHASDALPEALRARGAHVTAVAGHRVTPAVSRQEVAAAFSQPHDILALANPATVRLLDEAIVGAGGARDRCLARMVVAAVGPATAQVARARGFAPDLVAAGRLRRLVESLQALVCQEKCR